MRTFPRASLRWFAGAIGLCLAGCGTSGNVAGDDVVVPGDDDASVPDGGGPVVDGGVDPDPDALLPDPDAAPPDANPQPQTLTVCATGGSFPTIGGALAAASAGDTIEVCAGTYHERIVIENLAITITAPSGAAATILDGDGAGTVVTVRNSVGTGVVLQGFQIRNGRSSAIGGGILCEDSTLTLSNSHVTTSTATTGGGGLAAVSCVLDIGSTLFNLNEGGTHGGGAMVVTSSGEIHHNGFISNTAREGGGLTSFEGSVAVKFNEFRANSVRQRGGAMFHVSDAEITSNAVLENTTPFVCGGIFVAGHAPLISFNEIRGNTAVNDGGGVYLDNSSATLRSNHVHGNSTGDDGGGIRSFESSCTMEANLVEDNTAGDSGGGVRISHVPCLVIDQIVRDNYASGTGGGYDLDNDASTLRGGEITGNYAGGSGGGIFNWLSPFWGTKLENIKIAGNRAYQGGGIYIQDNYKPMVMKGLTIVDNRAGRGGGIMASTTDYTLTDSLIARNKATTGAGIYHAAPELPDPECGLEGEMPCPPLHGRGTISFSVIYANYGGGAAVQVNDEGLTVTSSIIAGHVDAALATDPLVPPPTWRYNDTIPATFIGMEPPMDHSGNISADPQFVDPETSDFHLGASSPCLEAGDPAFATDGGDAPDQGLIGGAP